MKEWTPGVRTLYCDILKNMV